MKDTGIIRRIDELGRIVIPKEIRKNLKMNTGDNVEIYMDENHKIVLKKHSTLFGMEEELFNIAKVINELSNCSVIFTDLDKVIISYGKESEKYFHFLFCRVSSLAWGCRGWAPEKSVVCPQTTMLATN